MARILLKTCIKNGLDSMFYRLVIPLKNVEGSPKVIPDVSLGNIKSVYIPTSEAAINAQQWTFKVLEVSITDSEKLCTLKDKIIQNHNTILYIHGFKESANSISVRTIMNGFLERGDHNIILLDWSLLGRSYFLLSFASIEETSDIIKESLMNLEENGVIDTSSLHIVGHSEGAHIAGTLCRKLDNVKRLTALDPAGHFFKWRRKVDTISKEVAKFVDVIHTDGTRFGVKKPFGHVDFFPNGGKRLQPGCEVCFKLPILHPKRLCSHWMSWRFFAESLVHGKAFLAGAAESWEDFKRGKMSNVIPMGFEAPEGSSGCYYLQTAGKSPFGKGENGLKYIEEIKYN